MEIGFCYNFPALRGMQAGKEYYVAMCPLRLIPKIFLFDEEEVPAEFRSQRVLNKNRVPDIANYMVNNPSDYVFSSLTASIDGEVQFLPSSTEKSFQDLGQLQIALDARFLINDGQHRRLAIEEALKLSPELGNETISVVFFIDEGLKKSQQIFSDLNRHAVNTTTSIGILYDHRDKLSMMTKEVIESNPMLNRFTDKERTTLSQNSPKIFALNHIHNANLKLLGKTKGDEVAEASLPMMKEFWRILTEQMKEWNQVANKEISAKHLRSNSIVGNGLFIEAVGIIGHDLIKNHPAAWKDKLLKLCQLDYSRSNQEDWLGRAFGSNGRINKTRETVTLTVNQIKEHLNLPLSEMEQRIEDKFRESAL